MKQHFAKSVFYTAAVLALLLLTGCAGVRVATLSTEKYMTQRRGDILTSGELSAHTMSALLVLGLDIESCARNAAPCRQALLGTEGLRKEQTTAALAELWLQEAMRQEKKSETDAAINAYLETARHAYAYLFLSERPVSLRALEERQTQVRDYYNFAVQQAITQLFSKLGPQARPDASGRISVSSWNVHVEFDGQERSTADPMPEAIYPASALSFAGLRNQYRRDGLGAEMVATMPALSDGDTSVWSAMRYPTLTALLDFPGNNLADVLATRSTTLRVYDPYRIEQLHIRGHAVPLAGNFTAGYGLWLARSSFATQSLATLFGRGDMLETPHVFLLQPYQPNRRTVIMIHGLASSPEAWINVANEIMGDEVLVRNYQIWQVYYPTSHPIAINNHAVREAVTATIQALDPGGNAPASRDILLVGHSMGGILSRLMVSSSEDRLWEELLKNRRLTGSLRRKAQQHLHDYLFFEPVPQIGRAVFIAAPHRGSPLADGSLVRHLAGLVTLPVKIVKGVIDPALALIAPEIMETSRSRSINGISNLSSRDPFILASASLPLAPGLPFHSIIGSRNPDVPPESSTDGVVPYSSSHLPGASSEKIITAGHSVQETPEAILELRRIMHLHLARLASSR